MLKKIFAVPLVALLAVLSIAGHSDSVAIRSGGAAPAVIAQAVQPVLSTPMHTARKAANSLAVPVVQATWSNSVPAPIDRYFTDFSVDAVLVHTTAPFVDLGCGDTDAYETDPNSPGNHTQQAALLAAFLSGKSVQISVQGCSFNNRPKIIGVSVLK